MRRKVVAGNWKMHTTPKSAVTLAKEIQARVSSLKSVDVIVCPPYVSLDRVCQSVAGTNVAVGAQDLHWEDQGAFTGKISHDMLTELGVQYVIIGHSEQRSYFHETDETVNKKSIKALASSLLPIICVGETLSEREAGQIEAVISRQVKGAYAGISKADAAKTIIAYEPVWAIGTGKTASPQQAQEVHAFIRKLVAELYDTELANGLRIQYGGSVKADNAAELFGQADIDGGLIGGAALKVDDFVAIVEAAQ
ncbi:MAG: triose-phosphate isomerase [Leptospiraceae bacterium]|nr:triose-phosphate isomerase [Leptospiraceae bacterium]